ncbi:MAG: alpha/beta hydrolase [Betaproteobacteria bacterium]|nr:alpha/beta hydrolase [Betaproteobacteria bacterium]
MTLFLATAVAPLEASACDNQTNGWVNGATNYWHGALGKTDFCNNASVGADRQKAADCAWNFTIARFGSSPDDTCARNKIETSPQGKADLDDFLQKWQVATGADCSQSSINLFFPYWHGALGKAEFCNNAAIGPDRNKAKECAFQALVRDKGVAPTSCLKDAIANSTDGSKDLDDFVKIWQLASGADCSQATIDYFFSYWHGALGKPEYCNNAAVGPNRQMAIDCAFQALRDIGVAANSCLRDAIPNTPAGTQDLDDFVAKWTVASGADCSQSSIDFFFNYWHGALGRADYCNNAAIGPDRNKAKECAFQALVRDKGVSPTSCLKDAIADSPSGKKDLDDFVSKWQTASGNDCSQASIDFFFNYWHGALGKAEVCNNAAVGPDRMEAQDCAFQALVRDKGVSPTSCLRDAIANSPEGKKDLDDFVRKWTAMQSTRPPGTVSANMTSLTPADAEVCDPTKALAENFFPPIAALDWSPTVPGEFKVKPIGFTLPGDLVFDATQHVTNALGANEGRLRPELRAAAKRADPRFDLCESAKAFAHDDTVLGRAFADLSVTGKRSFAQFRQIKPTEKNLVGCTGNTQAVASALNRAYNVANAIRFANSPDRRRLGWIAVSGEDDQPHRPVNVPAGEFPQYDLSVTVPVRGYNGMPPPPSITLNTRYMMAQPAPAGLAKPPHDVGRFVPDDPTPVLDPDAEVILFIHGMDSRLEEALDLTHALHKIGAKSGKKYAVIAMDLPTSGYADNIDHLRIASLETTGVAKFRPVGARDVEITDLKIFDAGARNNVPVVDFIEDFIVAFVDKLDSKQPGLKQRVRAVVGGSLGGNMSMRLGRRAGNGWIMNVVPWSPAAIWPSYVEGSNLINHIAVAVPWLWAGGDPRMVAESDVMRRLFFYYAFDWRMGMARQKPQAEEWYRDDWNCKEAHMFGARLDRHETYDSTFRLWHWRLGAEQLVFSQQLIASDTRQPLYMQNTTRMLLACGYDDAGGDLCKYARAVAWKMTTTPGKAVFLRDTGHSIHNERPNWLARAIVDFIEGR